MIQENVDSSQVRGISFAGSFCHGNYEPSCKDNSFGVRNMIGEEGDDFPPFREITNQDFSLLPSSNSLRSFTDFFAEVQLDGYIRQQAIKEAQLWWV
eukprot:TRINITY_DN7523_c0_g1_i1.p2 TRINITY_DN7523_c0_g1~~TRINITY_DN7523_c0_g1_i1.p2  ORF type:complete len:97 (+),score=12.42 TRINITY_DN7523_c0_g1_i1:171-461(+)